MKTMKKRGLFLIGAVLLLAAVFFALNYNSLGPAQTKEAASVEGDLKILKSEVSETAKFYPYKSGDTYMEIIAVKGKDGNVKTAFNTCQVCFDSGRGYYKQEGDKLICQNCGNAYGIEDIEKAVKFGCNPIPIMAENKQDDGASITISKDFIAGYTEYFKEWKK